MQQPYETILCRSKRGWVAGLPHGLAYAFTYQNISLHLTEEEIGRLKQQLEDLEAPEWFRLPDGKFILLTIPRLEGCFYLGEVEVNEMKDLLGEAAAMVKVHQCLLNRVR